MFLGHIFKAVLCAALFVSQLALASEVIIEHRGLSITCIQQGTQIKLLFRSKDQRGQIKIQSDSGNRLSSTINKNSQLIYSMSAVQFPITVFYDLGGLKTEFMISRDCSHK